MGVWILENFQIYTPSLKNNSVERVFGPGFRQRRINAPTACSQDPQNHKDRSRGFTRKDGR
jgi:hypothetical protein